MGDLAGCKASLRLGLSFGSSDDIRIKCERYSFDPEIDKNRSRTTDNDCVKRTVMTGKQSGILEVEGYFDPTGDIINLSVSNAPPYQYPAFYNLIFYQDADSIGTTSSQIVFFDEDDLLLPGAQVSDFRWTGETTEGGMQRFRVTIDAQFGSAGPYVP